MLVARVSFRSIALVAATLFAAGCSGQPMPDEAPEPVAPGADAAAVPAPVDDVVDLAGEMVATLPLPDGAEIRFYAHDDDSVSVIEEGTSDHITVTTRPGLVDANAYEVFHALSPEGTAAPEALLRHHRAMLASQGVAETAAPPPQGWALGDVQAVASGGGCVESIEQFVCTEGGGDYPSGPGCSASLTTGVRSWYDNDQAMRRYRTGVCSTGTVEAIVTGHYAGPGDCIVFRPLFVYRDGLYANKNWHFWWSGPSGATPRSFSNRVEHISGAGFAWGVREKWHTSSSCEI